MRRNAIEFSAQNFSRNTNVCGFEKEEDWKNEKEINRGKAEIGGEDENSESESESKRHKERAAVISRRR